MADYIFSVITRLNQYNACVGENPHLSGWTRHYALNTPENNVSVAHLYNQFIQQTVLQDPSAGWIIFCHQDFEFLEDPLPILQTLSPKAIYGPLGMQRKPGAWLTRGQAYGQLTSGPYVIGKRTATPQPVDTLDCCCVMVHASLLKETALRFDDFFDFHLYAEDFCLQARQKNIAVYALQAESVHYSNGTLNQAFFDKYEHLLNKFPQEPFVTMCVHIRFGKKWHFPSRKTVKWYDLLVKGILPVKTRIRKLQGRLARR